MEPFVLDKELLERTKNPNSDFSPDPLLLYVEPWTQQFEQLSVGFTTRHGGVGKAPYATLNCAYHVGDDPEVVLNNRRLVTEKLGFAAEAWTCGEQVHGKHVAVITAEDRSRGLFDRQSALQDTDGLVTNVPGVLLTSFYADCVPLYFYDPVQQAVGLAHAGWKGTVAGIAVSMVETMEREAAAAGRTSGLQSVPRLGIAVMKWMRRSCSMYGFGLMIPRLMMNTRILLLNKHIEP